MGHAFNKLVPAVFVLLALSGIADAQYWKQDKTKDDHLRSVEGLVTDPSGKALNGAVVQLKDAKTLQIRSFFTKEDGTYHFAGLSTNVEYELKGAYQGATSSAKTLSVFDSRKKATLNLKIGK